jgi:Fe-S-cluster-containing dehydrogenase component
MSINRRDFLKTIGVAGLTLAVGDSFGKTTEKEKEIEFNAVLYDSTMCIGCMSCEFACAEAYGFPEPVDEPKIDVVRKTNENRRGVINLFNTSKGEMYMRNQCMHCSEPACVAACLTKAMYKTKEGPVIWREEKCMGCRYCMVSCPFDVPKFEYHSSNPKIEKCTMCFEKQQKGEKPACVSNCPAEALIFGTRKELLEIARKRIVENPDNYYPHIYGEHEAGGTSFLILSAVPANELGLKTNLQNQSYPKLTKGFLYSVPAVFVLLPTFLLGLYEATKRNRLNENNEDEQ